MQKTKRYLISAIAVFIAIFLALPYSAYAQSTTTTTTSGSSTTTSSENHSPNPNSDIACGRSPQQSPQAPIPPYCARLIVIKEVDNTLGGNAVPSEFTFSVTGNNPSLSTFQGSSSGTTIVLAPGSYQITEVSELPNYHHHRSHCESGGISAGQTKTCTIINQFSPPVVDTEPPQVVSITATPNPISLSSGGTITIQAHLTDATGVQQVNVSVQDQCGNGLVIQSGIPLALVSGTAQDGIWQAQFTFTQDALDRVSPYCSSDGGTNAKFQVVGVATDSNGYQAGNSVVRIDNIILTSEAPADTQPPQVVSFTVNPMRVSLSSGGTAIITAHVTDQTAVERVGVYVQDQCGNSPGFFQSLQLPLVSGTPQDGIYQATFTFPQSAYDNVVQSCSPNGIDAYFEAGGGTSDTLGHVVGLPLIINIVLTR